MASVDAPSREENQEQKSADLNFELRRILNNAYGFVLGEQATQSLKALTYEELADKQIERIEGAGTSLRPNELERLDRLETELLQAVEKVRNIPPEQFLIHDSRRDVNTPPEG